MPEPMPQPEPPLPWQEILCTACGGYLLTARAAAGIQVWHRDCAPEESQ